MFFPNAKIMDRYLTYRILGRGGMGEVWKCYDEILNRFVVIKSVSPELANARPQHTDIFIDEARIGASLVGHPNVVTTFDLINEPKKDDPILAIVMEFVEGISCASWIEKHSSTLDAATKHYISLQIAIDTCKAVGYAHRHTILHRDIKPLNIFISKYGLTKIGDFGISRYADAVTREHTVWNFRSPAYSAPEQWLDEKPTTETDVYQLGCTLFHLFTGNLPFEASSVSALIQKHLTETPKSPKILNNLISQELSDLIEKSLHKKKTDRPDIWQIVDALSNDIQKKYTLDIEFDGTNEELVQKIFQITEFNAETMRNDGNFSYTFPDYNEAISEAIELTLLDGIKVKLEIENVS